MGKKRSKKRRKKRGKMGECLIFAAFMLMGIVVTCLFTIVPGKMYLSARDWLSVPCTIQESGVKELNSSSSRGGTSSYVPHIVYTYERDGVTYTADRYSVFDTRTTEGNARAIAAGFPADTEASCYVDPATPSRAMLNRDFSWTILYGMGGICFFVIGVAGIYNTLTGKWNQVQRKTPRETAAPEPGKEQA